MKISTLVSLALLAMVSGKAFGHMVYYSDCDDTAEANAEAVERDGFDSVKESSPDLSRIATGGMTGVFGLSGQKNSKSDDEEEKCYSSEPSAKKLREENPESPESDRLAALSFCKAGGYANPVDCASDVIAKNLVKEAIACLESFEHDVSRFNLTAHVAEGGGSKGQGTWHIDYKYSKEGGWHRHSWTPEAREKAGILYAGAMIDRAKNNQAVKSRSASEAHGNKEKAGGTAEAGWAGILKSALNFEKERNKESRSTTERGPLTTEEIKEIEDKYRPLGEGNPTLADVSPDMVCYKYEKTCSSSSQTGLIPNASYEAAPSKKVDDAPANKRDDSSEKKSSDNNNPTSKAPKSSSFETSIEHKDHGIWAGEPSNTPGQVWADYSQEGSELDSMANCLFLVGKEKVKDEGIKKYDSQGKDQRSDAEKKRDAEAALSKGLCVEQYFGKSYCEKWRKERGLMKRPVETADKEINRPTRGQPGTQGELHFIQPEPKAPTFDKDFMKTMPYDDSQPAGTKKFPGLKD